MQVPRRKPGKYTNLKPDAHMTPEKLAELKNKLEKLKTIRPQQAAEVKELSTTGDFSENAGYQMAKGRLRGINQRILDLEEMIKNAVIIRGKKSGSVELGSTVTVEIGGREKKYKILGSSETDPGRGVISHNSAVGRALLGRKAGEMVKIRPGDKDKEVIYKIIKIE
ncbi:MAG: GreA/GreB family elongation factor [Patescibacteria group bacterium]|nr:GreA/GreB family elongation factor [Patescibacteria group bacterium]MDD5294995.1 GreA/GreB family elongation factor [Patescibacteria group bacterium]MDD5554356.1 GreA/GreB family elongation factor [Patescibacteria group bacterium]